MTIGTMCGPSSVLRKLELLGEPWRRARVSEIVRSRLTGQKITVGFRKLHTCGFFWTAEFVAPDGTHAIFEYTPFVSSPQGREGIFKVTLGGHEKMIAEIFRMVGLKFSDLVAEKEA